MNILEIRFRLLCSSLAQKPYVHLFGESPVHAFESKSSEMGVIRPYVDSLEKQFGIDMKCDIYNNQMTSFVAAQWVATRLKLDELETVVGHIPNKIHFIDFCHDTIDKYKLQLLELIRNGDAACILECERIHEIDEEETKAHPEYKVKDEEKYEEKRTDRMWEFTSNVYHQMNARLKQDDLAFHDPVSFYDRVVERYPDLAPQLEFMQTSTNAFGPLNELVCLALRWGLFDEFECNLIAPPAVAFMKYLITKQAALGATKQMSKAMLVRHRSDELIHLLRFKNYLIK